MTILRVTNGSIQANSLSSIRTTSSNLANLQAQLSSGKRIQQPSDDPTGAVQAMKLRGSISRNEQYGVNADDAKSWLSAGDSAFNQMIDIVQQARTTVVKGLNSGASDATANEALAQQIDGLRTSLLSQANAQYNGRPLFGGTTAGGSAYDTSGNYVGDTGAVSRIVGADNVVSVSSTGPAVFGSGSTDIFATLSDIATKLRTNPSSLSGSLGDLDAAISRMSAAQSTAAAQYQQVDRAQTAQVVNGTAMTTQLGNIEQVDLAEMAIKVSTANVAYQAALQTTASVRQVSLMDFLR